MKFLVLVTVACLKVLSSIPLCFVICSPEVRTFLNLETVERNQSSDEDDEVESLNQSTDGQVRGR